MFIIKRLIRKVENRSRFSIKNITLQHIYERTHARTTEIYSAYVNYLQAKELSLAFIETSYHKPNDTISIKNVSLRNEQFSPINKPIKTLLPCFLIN